MTAILSLRDIVAGNKNALGLNGLDHLGQGAAALLAIGRIVTSGNGHFASHLTGCIPFENPADPKDNPRAEFLGWFRIGREWRPYGDLLGWADVDRPEVLYVLYSSYVKAMRAAGKPPLAAGRIGRALHSEDLLLDRNIERDLLTGEITERRYTKRIWLNGELRRGWCVLSEHVLGRQLPDNPKIEERGVS